MTSRADMADTCSRQDQDPCLSFPGDALKGLPSLVHGADNGARHPDESEAYDDLLVPDYLELHIRTRTLRLRRGSSARR